MHNKLSITQQRENIWSQPETTAHRRGRMLTLDDKINIIYGVVVSREHQADVAKRYRRSQAYVSQLVKKAQSNKELLRKLIDKQEQKL